MRLNSQNLLRRCLITTLVPMSRDSKQQRRENSLREGRGMKVQDRGPFFCFGGKKAPKIKSARAIGPYPRPSQPRGALPSTRSRLEPWRSPSCPHPQGWAGEAMKTGARKGKGGTHRSFEDSDKERHPEQGGGDAPRRLGGGQILWEKSPGGPTGTATDGPSSARARRRARGEPGRA